MCRWSVFSQNFIELVMNLTYALRSGSIILLLALFFPVAEAQSLRLAFGSCAYHDSPKQPWQAISAQNPDLWLWLGDIIYADTDNISKMRQIYKSQKQRPDYQQFRAQTPIFGVWDDHDYGTNDGGKFYPNKAESQAALLDFLDIPKEAAIRQQKGVYQSFLQEKESLKVRIILLDTRYFRDTLLPDNNSEQRYLPNPTGDILGEAQWQWLEQIFQKESADLFVIASSIQVLAEEQYFEKWANFPKARKRLLALLAQYPQQKVLLLSGDRHIAEIARNDRQDLPYPLYDFTSSGMTHTWKKAWREPNRYRQGKLLRKKNFGVVEINKKAGKLEVYLRAYNHKGKLRLEERVDFD